MYDHIVMVASIKDGKKRLGTAAGNAVGGINMHWFYDLESGDIISKRVRVNGVVDAVIAQAGFNVSAYIPGNIPYLTKGMITGKILPI